MTNIKAFPRYVNSFQVKDILPIEEIQYNPLSYLIKSTTVSDRLVLNELLKIARISPDIFPSHETISLKINRCRKTVTRAIARLQELGLINYLFRPNKSSLYRPSSFLLLEWVREILSPIIPALSWISSKFLSIGQWCFSSIQSTMSHDILPYSNLNILLSNSITEVNYDNNKGQKVVPLEVVVNPRIEKLRELLTLEFYEAQGLSKYPDWILDKALKRVDKIQTLQHKSEYLFALCENELKPKPKVERSYNYLREKYPSSDNLSTVKPPSHNEWKPAEKKIEVLTEQVLDEKVMLCEYKEKKNPFFGFVVTALVNKFKHQE